MEKENYKKVELPINIKEASIKKPDFKWLGIMVGTILGIVGIIYGFFHFFSIFVVSNLSIEREKELFGGLFTHEKKLNLEKLNFQIPEFEGYTFYIDEKSEEINAYAALGGSIILTKALLENTTNEEEIIFIMAHELGHVEKRHNIKRLSKILPMKITLEYLGINLGFYEQDLLEMSYSRNDENEADDFALELFNKYDLNSYCASDFFAESESKYYPEMLSTHPNSNKRFEKLINAGDKNGECRKFDFENILEE